MNSSQNVLLVFILFLPCNLIDMRRFFQFIFRTILYIFIILIGMLVAFYLMVPVYQFSGPVKFNGDQLYNPYENIDPSHWKKYNFQVQSKAWLGITDGRKNSNELIDSIYTALGFDHVTTSDYQKINYYGKEKSSFIPTYEHGYNIFKTHQVCIDAKSVLWTDFILFQTRSMKQWVIDQLKQDCSIVAIAHPRLWNGYTLSDMKYLTNYRMMEVLSGLFISTERWDVALTSGQVVWIIGSDDAHNVLHLDEVGRKFTLINSKSTDKNKIITSLLSGKNYGIDYYLSEDTSIAEKATRLKQLPFLISAELKGDTFSVVFSKKARELKFIGENGIVRKTVSNTKAAHYIIQPDDPYIRTEANFSYTYSIYLNPVIRYKGEFPKSLKTATIDTTATLRLRILYFLIILSLVFLYVKWKQRKSSK